MVEVLSSGKVTVESVHLKASNREIEHFLVAKQNIFATIFAQRELPQVEIFYNVIKLFKVLRLLNVCMFMKT